MDPNTKIIRYISFPQFFHMVENELFYFSLASSFADRNEFSALSEEFSSSFQGISELPTGAGIGTISNGNPVDLGEIARIDKEAKLKKEMTYVSCWSLGHDENYALWKIFSVDSEGVAILSTISSFLNSFSDHTITSHQKIEYGKNQVNLNPLFYKNDCYKYENEYRFLIEKDNKTKLPLKYLGQNTKLQTLIHEVRLSPFSKFLTKLDIAEYLHSKNLNIKVSNSKIAEGNRSNIPSPFESLYDSSRKYPK